MTMDGIASRINGTVTTPNGVAVESVARRRGALLAGRRHRRPVPRQVHGGSSHGLGGPGALAARALIDTDKDAEAIVRRGLDIAADICVYTNRNVTIESL